MDLFFFLTIIICAVCTPYKLIILQKYENGLDFERDYQNKIKLLYNVKAMETVI